MVQQKKPCRWLHCLLSVEDVKKRGRTVLILTGISCWRIESIHWPASAVILRPVILQVKQLIGKAAL
uniref:Uncharacterized protein n=1 Tax=Cannabis sativa TaxID=3483 RepID=A0A803R5Z7_CANSA